MSKRVRVVRAFATASRGYAPGSVVTVSDQEAEAWLRAGLVEEDKALDGPKEVKRANQARKPAKRRARQSG